MTDGSPLSPSPTRPTPRHGTVETGLGALDVVIERGPDGTDAIAGIYYPDHRTHPDRAAWGPRVAADEPLITAVRDQFTAYLAGTSATFDLPLAPRGTEFQRAVWGVLATIPRGQTLSYGQVAARVGTRNAQLVGQAVGHNPLSVVVPCHRVVGADGSLTGYAGGLGRKARLLELEGALPESLLDHPADPV